MILRDINDIYEIAPPITVGGVSNRSLPAEEMITYRVQGISCPDLDALELQDQIDAGKYDRSRCIEEQQKRRYALVKSKVQSIHNYRIRTADGGEREVTSFDEWYKVAPKEQRDWLFAVAHSGEALTAADRANFLPQSASPSCNP